MNATVEMNVVSLYEEDKILNEDLKEMRFLSAYSYLQNCKHRNLHVKRSMALLKLPPEKARGGKWVDCYRHNL